MSMPSSQNASISLLNPHSSSSKAQAYYGNHDVPPKLPRTHVSLSS
jgi:hypothetical protein